MKTTTTLSEATLKALALMQYNGEDFFIVDGKAYEGNETEKRAHFKEYQDEGGIFDFGGWCEEDETEVSEYEENGNDYLVLTDEEADEKWDESLDSYIDECVLSEIPENYRNYFDSEKWKDDAKQDGRGHSLSTYDGHENEETVEGETFYIYRLN